MNYSKGRSPLKGLRLTRIFSERETPDGIKLTFPRYQIWEHEIEFTNETRPFYYHPGKILHHFREDQELEARAYFMELSPRYIDSEVAEL